MRLKDKIKEIEGYLADLSDIMPKNFEEYNETRTKFACERLFEIIIEAIVDLAFFIIKEKELKIPEEDKEAFDILSKEKIISQELAERFKDAKGMRNIIAHEYGKINDEIVFHAIAEDIERDVKGFINSVKNKVK